MHTTPCEPFAELHWSSSLIHPRSTKLQAAQISSIEGVQISSRVIYPTLWHFRCRSPRLATRRESRRTHSTRSLPLRTASRHSRKRMAAHLVPFGEHHVHRVAIFYNAQSCVNLFVRTQGSANLLTGLSLRSLDCNL